MAEETLLSAARRLVRFIRIDDQQSGGLISIETLLALETLDKMISAEREKEKKDD
jgi:hypothetical protein